MASETVDWTLKERLLRDIALWQTDGLISRDTAAVLRDRYGAPRFGLGEVLRYLGIVGLIFVACGILGLIGALSRSPVFAGVLLLLVGAAFGFAGIRYSNDRLGRYRWSSKTALALGVMAISAAVLVLIGSSGVALSRAVFIGGWVVLPIVVAVAYRTRITFLLVIALIEFFHWVGSWTSMWGRSTYALDVQDPRLMSAAAIVVIVIGIVHEEALAERTGRFFAAYESLGLVYLNLSLLILSIERPDAVLWIGMLTIAAFAEIVLGAWLKNPIMLGFGVTFLFIDGFTRFYERFWDSWTKAAFFLGIGLITFAAGAACEFALRSRKGQAR